jgi:hypothetical protein
MVTRVLLCIAGVVGVAKALRAANTSQKYMQAALNSLATGREGVLI